MNKPTQLTAVGAMSLALNALLTATGASNTQAAITQAAPAAGSAGADFAKVNQATLASIESSYLKIPGICKAGNAAFEPAQAPITGEAVSSAIVAIHQALGQA